MSAVVALKTEETYELVDEAFAGSVDDAVVQEIARALIRHTEEVSDEAQLVTQPLDRDEAMQMASRYDHVAAYVLTTLDQIYSREPSGMKEYLASLVASDIGLFNIDYEIVWGGRQSLILYVRGSVET